MFKPLNPQLFKQLSCTFPSVKLQDAGVQAEVSYRPQWFRGEARLTLDIRTWGETYIVSCPFCSDTRHRLSVNHLWGLYDPKTRSNHLHLATCFNEGCLAEGDNRRKLHAMICPRGLWSERLRLPAQPHSFTSTASFAPPVLPPGIPLHQLPATNEAVAYLRGRGYCTDTLSRERGIVVAGPCESSQPKLFEPRIIIPICGLAAAITTGSKAAEILVGWQARLAREPGDHDRKYLNSTGLKKSHHLYGLTTAIGTRGPVVVVEGVADVWRVGPSAVALLGKTISPEQIRLIVKHFSGRPILIWLDVDAAGDRDKVRKQIADARVANHSQGAVVCVDGPAGVKDPGGCTPEQVQKVLAPFAAKSSKRKSRIV